MKRKVTSAVMVGSIAIAGGALAVPQSASATETQTQNTTDAHGNDMTSMLGESAETQGVDTSSIGLSELQMDMEQLAEASAELSEHPAFGEFAYESQMAAEQHQVELMMVWQKACTDMQGGADPQAVQEEMNTTYDEVNTRAMASYEAAKDKFMGQLDQGGVSQEAKDKFSTAYDNTTAEATSVLEQVKTEMNQNVQQGHAA